MKTTTTGDDEEKIEYVGLWIDEDDVDDTTIGGGEAFRTDDEQDAIERAKRLTKSGHRCYVENNFGNEVWYPDDEPCPYGECKGCEAAEGCAGYKEG